MRVNNRLISTVTIENLAQIKDGILEVQLRKNYSPQAKRSEVVELEGNEVNLKLLGIDVSAEELTQYSHKLEDRGFRLSDIIRACFVLQAYNWPRIIPALPIWSNFVELIGLMHYFEHSGIGLGVKSRELKKQLNGHAKSFCQSLNLHAAIESASELSRLIGDFVSELRFAQEVSKAGFKLEFKREGVDLEVKYGSSFITIDVFRKSSNLFVELKNPGNIREVSLSSVIAHAVKDSVGRLEEKFRKKYARLIAVDLSHTVQGFELLAIRSLLHDESLLFENQITTALGMAKEGPVVLFFAHANSINPYTVVFPLSQDLLRTAKVLS